MDVMRTLFNIAKVRSLHLNSLIKYKILSAIQEEIKIIKI